MLCGVTFKTVTPAARARGCWKKPLVVAPGLGVPAATIDTVSSSSTMGTSLEDRLSLAGKLPLAGCCAYLHRDLRGGSGSAPFACGCR